MSASPSSLPQPTKVTVAALTAFVIASLFYLYQYVIRTAPGTFLAEIQTSMGIDLGTASGMVGALMYTYGAGCLLTGPALDKFGVRRALPFGALFIGVGSLMMASGNYEVVALGRLVQGAGCSFAFVACAFIAAKYLPVAVLALATGAAQSFGMSGGSLGGKPLADLAAAQTLSFSRVSLILGVIGLVFTVAIFLLMPRQRPGEGQNVTFIAPLKAVLRNPQSWLLGFVAGAMFAPTTVGDMALGMTFFTRVYHFNAFGASLVTLLPLGWVLGAPVMGMISDRIGSRRWVLIPSILFLLALSAYTRTTDLATLSYTTLAIIMFAFGVVSGSAMVAYAAIKEANPPQYAGTSSGVINAINFTMGALLSSVIGRLIHAYALDASGNVISVQNFNLTTLPIPSMLCLALPAMFFVKETGTRKK